MSTGTLHYGDIAGQEVSARIGGTVADETALAAVPAKFRSDGQVYYTADTGKSWMYKLESDATASDSVIAPAAGSGRFHLAGGGSGGAAGATAVRLATAAALAAYTRTANVILADVNGAMATVDGVAPAVGDLILLKDGAAGADNGIYVVDSLGGGAAKYQLTRAPGFDDSDGFTANPFMVAVSEGTVSADNVFILSTNAPITLNTTALAFTRLPNLADLASVASGEGASLIGVQDADSVFAGTTAEAVLTEVGTAAVACATPVHNVRCAGTANIAALATTAETQDGVTMVAGDRILLKNQTAPEENGIYVMGTIGGGVGPLTRATDFDNAANVRTGSLVSVSEGTAAADTVWRLSTNAPITVGTTGLTFVDVVHDVTGATAGTITDTDSCITGTTINAALQEVGTAALPLVTPVHRVRCAGTANIAALATTAETQDGVTMVQGDRILLKNQTAPEENGVYVMGVVGGGVGPLTRAVDFDNAANVVSGALVAVSEGTAGADTVWQLTTNAPITVGTTGLVFVDVVHDTSGAAAGAITDTDGLITGATIEAALAEIAAGGLVGRAPLRLARGASTANVANLAAFTVANDGITFVEGELVLLKDQTAPEENGVYSVGTVGGGTAPLTRVTNYDGATEVKSGTVVLVSEGTANLNTIWQLTTNDPIVVGTTGLVYAEVWSAARGLAATGAAAGTIADALNIIAATTIEGATQELALKNPGTAQVNRSIVNNAGAAIPAADFITIGADTYEFNGATPPAAGTGGYIWVYNGANAAASRTNLVDAINGVVDAARITRGDGVGANPGTNTELVTAVAGVPATGITWYTSTAIGSAVPRADATPIVCVESLTHALDIFDQANTYAGVGAATQQNSCTGHTVTAAEVTAASLEFYFPFAVDHAIVFDSTQGYHDEAVTWTGNYVSVTLTGGAAPNIQVGNVLVCVAYG